MSLLRVLAAVSCIANPVYAADFSVGKYSGGFRQIGLSDGYVAAYITLHGPIIAGDYFRFLDVLKKANEQNLVITDIFLDSPGGLVSEAIKIGRSVRKNLILAAAPDMQYEVKGDKLLATYYSCVGSNAVDRESGLPFNEGSVVDENCICASACALIYFAGVTRSGDALLHRSFISGVPEDMEFEEFESELAGSHSMINSYLEEMRVPEWVARGIMATASDDLVKLNSLPDFDSSIAIDPVFKEYVLSHCPSKETAAEKKFIDWVLDRNLDVAESEMERFQALMEELGRREEVPPNCTAKLYGRSQEAAQMR